MPGLGPQGYQELTCPTRTTTLITVMKNKFKFEITFNLDTAQGEKLDKQSIKNFERDLFDFVNNYAGYEGSFYTYSKDSDGETMPDKIKVKRVALS